MARQKQRVPTVEEIQARNKHLEEGGVIKVPVVRTSTPVSTIPTDQTPPETLSTRTEKQLSVTEILQQHGLDPIEELLAMYNERNEDPESPDYGKFVMSRPERVSLMKEIMRYQHPTLKAVEHKGNDTDRRITVVLMMPDGTRAETSVAQRGEAIDV